jgi:hypothetical protein
MREVYWRSLIFDSADFYEKASAAIQESFSVWRELLALNILYFEQEAGEYMPESSEDILRRLEYLAPHLDWRAQLKWVPEALLPQMWDIIETRFKELNAAQAAFVKPIAHFSGFRRYFASELGYLGWVPRSAQEGDRICAFYGCRFPFVIRPKWNGFQLIGACYMHGIMEGEAIELPNTEGSEKDIMITLM